jgi:hypothetical protein
MDLIARFTRSDRRVTIDQAFKSISVRYVRSLRPVYLDAAGGGRDG